MSATHAAARPVKDAAKTQAFCVIKMCVNAYGSVGSGELFFSPPHFMFKKGTARQKWIAAISLHQEIKFSDQFQVCARHFNAADINKTIGLLKLNAVPVHFPAPATEPRPANEQRVKSEEHTEKEAQEANDGSKNIELERLRAELIALQKTNADQRAEITRLRKSTSFYKHMYIKLANSAKVELERCDEPAAGGAVAAKPTAIENVVIVIAEDDEASESCAKEPPGDAARVQPSETVPPPPVLKLDAKSLSKPFQCAECNESFAAVNDLAAHMRTKADEQKRQQKEQRQRLKRSIAEVNPSPSLQAATTCGRTRRYQCFLCRMEFQRKPSLEKHMKRHARDKRCSICDANCTATELSHHFCGQSDRQIACEYCGQAFGSIVDMVNHLEVHDAIKKYYKCSRCPKFFAMQRLTELHETRHADAVDFACKICARVMLSSSAFKRHMLRHVTRVSEAVQEAFLCDECGKGFSAKRNLVQHKLTHGEPAYSCPLCPRKFYVAAALDRHSLTHRNRTFVCGMCGAELCSDKGLKRHMERHQGNDGERTFSCDLCPKKFFNQINFDKHRRNHNKTMIRHNCEYCDKVYKHRGDLNKHLRTHLGDLMYACDLCPRRFRVPRDLERHANEHYMEQKCQTEVLASDDVNAFTPVSF